MQRFNFGNAGTGNFPVSTSDMTGLNGDVYYNSTLNRFRGFGNGIWKNLAMEDTAALIGRTITVDPDHPFSTDVRTGISQYSSSVPFKTISAAVRGAISNMDTVLIRRCNAGSYTENVEIAPNMWSGWQFAMFKFEPGVIVNGNFTVTGINYETVSFICEGQAVINGSITGSNQIKLGHIKGMTIRDGFYGTSSIQYTVIIDSTITWVSQTVNSLSARSFYSKFTWNFPWSTYGLLETTKFTYCELKFNAGISPGAGGPVGSGSVDMAFTNCKIDIIGSAFDDCRFGGFRFLMRSCYVRFTDHLFSVTTQNTGIYAAHEVKFVNRNPGLNVINGGPTSNGWILEHINTTRNSPLGVDVGNFTVISQDFQVVSITEFDLP